MLSDPAPPPRNASRWEWLRSQGLGVCCGLATTLLLAVGSFVIARTRGGASAGVQLDDIRVFFRDASPAHLWFYLLLPVLGLYALNTLLATWNSVSAKWRNGFRQPQAYAAAVIHVGFLVAMLAHLVGGVGSREHGVLLDGDWRPLPDGRQARVLSVDVEQMPDGMPRSIRASLELQPSGGPPERAVIGFNEPLSRGFGSDLLLFQRPINLPPAVVLLAGDERCRLRKGETCRLGGHEVGLAELRGGGPHEALARLEAGGRSVWLARGIERPVADGLSIMFADVTDGEIGAVTLWRHTPGNPLALISAALLAIGVGLMWRRLI